MLNQNSPGSQFEFLNMAIFISVGKVLGLIEGDAEGTSDGLSDDGDAEGLAEGDFEYVRIDSWQRCEIIIVLLTRGITFEYLQMKEIHWVICWDVLKATPTGTHNSC